MYTIFGRKISPWEVLLLVAAILAILIFQAIGDSRSSYTLRSVRFSADGGETWHYVQEGSYMQGVIEGWIEDGTISPP